jgi:Leucine-rich repeat (LRR) protein
MKKDKFLIEQHEYGIHLRITSVFDSEIIDYIKNNSVAIISVDYFEGGAVPDHKILTQIPNKIIGIDTIDYEYDFSYIYHLKNLKYFRFTTYTRNPIDFTQFPLLDDVFLEYWPQAKSIFECKNLRKLYISGFKTKTMDEYTNLTNLEKLSISSAPIADLKGIEKLKKLKSLSLDFLTKLENLSAIEKLTGLEELDLESMKKFPDINVVSKLTKLKKLGLVDCGNIDSLKPISDLKELISLFFTGDTKILDGNLEFLRKMNFQRLSFANRKHYSLKREELLGYQNL